MISTEMSVDLVDLLHNLTNLTQFENDTDHNETDHSGGGSHTSHPKPILFVFFSCLLGALVRTLLKKIRVPYTVVLMALGCLIGVMSNYVPGISDYTTLASIDPHTILHVFLPVLIFESAFAMESHTFLKSFVQIIILAIPGLLLAAFVTCVFSMNVFSYGWSWEIGMLFGAIVSATDPVAVVALLKDVGASKQLGTIIEGESLLNDGAAIVLFYVFQAMAVPGDNSSGLSIFVYFVQVTFGGPLLGLIMGKLTTLWLVNIFNDALTEITITLCSTYLTFYIGEAFLGVSGVLAVVVLGLTVSAERTSISPEVEAFLHRFWEMLAYLANTLIFILVGVVITEKAVAETNVQDWFLLAALYLSVFVIRGLILGLFSPLLGRIGYGLTWRSALVMTWGGLRGAVGLALGLMVLQNHDIDPTGVTQNKILLHCAGLVMLTLLINATTVAPLLKMLGMSEISIPKRLAMASAVRNLKDVAETCLSSYKSDRFLADADWDIVDKYINIQDPYKTLEEEAALDELTNFQRTSLCPACDNHVPNEPSPKEWEEMQNEARLRLLKAEKTSYWKQFEHGMLSREAVRRLVEYVDTAADEQKTFLNTEEVSKNWQVGGVYEYMKKKLTAWQHQKPDTETVEWPENRVLKLALVVCLHYSFDIVLYICIFFNVIFVIMELAVEFRLTSDEIYAQYGIMFDVFNYIFLVIYIIEAALKLTAYQKAYFKNKWNLFDFIILIMSIIDVLLDIFLFSQSQELASSFPISPNILKLAKSVRLLRLLRSLRLVKGLIPQMIDFINHQINKKLRLGYDVGKGYITGEEDVLGFIDHMIDNQKVAQELKVVISKGRLHIMKELGLLQKNHPGIAVSIKTQQAARRILNNLREKIATLRGEGVLDEMEAHKLEVMVEMRMKMLMKIPATIQPPPPEKIIGNLSWVAGDELLLNYIKQNATLVAMQEGEELNVESDPKGGIYVIISGLVKVDKSVEDFSTRSSQYETKSNLEKLTDYLSTGSVLGEFSLLSGKASNTIVTSDTSTLMYQISYEAIQSALELFVEAPSLEYRLWRVAATRIAVPILKKQYHYRHWNQEKIKMHLEKCVLFMKKWELVEGGRAFKPYHVDLRSIYLSDIILIHGHAENVDTGDRLQGPCYVPQNLNGINLLPGKTEKHVMVILSRDQSLHLEEDKQREADEEDPHNALKSAIERNHSPGVMITPTERANSSLCLKHSAIERHGLEGKISQRKIEKFDQENILVRKVSSIIQSQGRHGNRVADHQEMSGVVYPARAAIDERNDVKNRNTGTIPPPPMPTLMYNMWSDEVISLDISSTPEPAIIQDHQTAHTTGTHSAFNIISNKDSTSSPKQTAPISTDQVTHASPNQTTHTTPNQATHTSPNQTTHTSPNQTTHTSSNQATHTSSNRTTLTPLSQTSYTSHHRVTHTSPNQTTHTSPNQTTFTPLSQTSYTSHHQVTHTSPNQATHTPPNQTTQPPPNQTTHTSPNQSIRIQGIQVDNNRTPLPPVEHPNYVYHKND